MGPKATLHGLAVNDYGDGKGYVYGTVTMADCVRYGNLGNTLCFQPGATVTIPEETVIGLNCIRNIQWENADFTVDGILLLSIGTDPETAMAKIDGEGLVGIAQYDDSVQYYDANSDGTVETSAPFTQGLTFVGGAQSPATGTGYSWDAETKTFTVTEDGLSVMTLGRGIWLPGGATIQLEGDLDVFSGWECICGEGSLKVGTETPSNANMKLTGVRSAALFSVDAMMVQNVGDITTKSWISNIISNGEVGISDVGNINFYSAFGAGVSAYDYAGGGPKDIHMARTGDITIDAQYAFDGRTMYLEDSSFIAYGDQLDVIGEVYSTPLESQFHGTYDLATKTLHYTESTFHEANYTVNGKNPQLGIIEEITYEMDGEDSLSLEEVTEKIHGYFAENPNPGEPLVIHLSASFPGVETAFEFPVTITAGALMEAPVITAKAGNEKVTVRWKAPEGDITGYTLTVGGKDYPVKANATKFVVKGLENGRDYTFTLTAMGGAGQAVSQPVTATPVAPKPVIPAVKPTVKPTIKPTEEPEEEITPVFDDVDEKDYYYDAVQWAVEEGITTGTSKDTFSPNMTCTRAQAVTFLWKANGSPIVKIDNPFLDVDEDSYYYNAVLWAVSEGVTKGTSATTFGPDAECTRGQIVTFLWNAAGNPVVNYLMTFVDVPDTWYTEAVRWAVSEGITSGMSADAFGPDRDCTRGQIVTFLYRNLAK